MKLPMLYSQVSRRLALEIDPTAAQKLLQSSTLIINVEGYVKQSVAVHFLPTAKPNLSDRLVQSRRAC